MTASVGIQHVARIAKTTFIECQVLGEAEASRAQTAVQNQPDNPK